MGRRINKKALNLAAQRSSDVHTRTAARNAELRQRRASKVSLISNPNPNPDPTPDPTLSPNPAPNAFKEAIVSVKFSKEDSSSARTRGDGNDGVMAAELRAAKVRYLVITP